MLDSMMNRSVERDSVSDPQTNEQYEKWKRYLQWAFAIGIVAILGSCVGRIDGVGGGHDSNQKMVVIFFFHLFLIVPCLFGLFVYVQLRLERYFLSEDAIDQMDQAHMKYARNEAKSKLGPLFSLFSRNSGKKDE